MTRGLEQRIAAYWAAVDAAARELAAYQRQYPAKYRRDITPSTDTTYGHAGKVIELLERAENRQREEEAA